MNDQQGNSIHYSITSAFLEKRPRDGLTDQQAWARPLQVRATLPSGLFGWILSGNTFAPGVFKGSRRKVDAFQSAQVIGIDLDANSVADAMGCELVNAYAALVYPTPSATPDNPRSRVLFILSEPVTDASRYRALVSGIAGELNRSGLQVDPAATDPARAFYGSLNKSEQPVIRPALRLPIATAAGLLMERAAVDMAGEFARRNAPQRRMVDMTDDYAAAAYSGILADLQGDCVAGNRNAALFKHAARLFGMVKGDWPGVNRESAWADCERIATAAGLPTHEVRATLKSAWASATPVDRKRPAPAPAPIHQRDITGREYANSTDEQPRSDSHAPVKWVSDDLPPARMSEHATLLIKAPLGMGKTQAVASYVRSLPAGQTVTGIAQFRLLTQALARALESEHYEDYGGANQRALSAVNRLTTSLNSLPRFDRQSDVLVVDEIEGVLSYLVAGKFKAGGAIASLIALKRQVTTARQLIGMDANLSPIAIEWVRALRPDVTVKHYRPGKRGKVTLLRDKTSALYTVDKLLTRASGPVYAACSSKTTADEIADRATAAGHAVLKVTEDTSNTDKVRRALKSADERARYALVVYTSAMGAGVSIDDPVAALVGIFDREPLDPEHALQLFGRVRNAGKRWAFCPFDSERETPTADELFAERLWKERESATLEGVTPEAGGAYLELLRLWSQFTARSEAGKARYRSTFARLLSENGYRVNANNARAPEAFGETLRESRKARAESDWRTVLTMPADEVLTTDTLDMWRRSQVEITRPLILRNIRHKIETALGTADVAETDEDLMTPGGRRRLVQFADLWMSTADLRELDKRERAEGRPLERRRYRLLQRRAFDRLLDMAGFDAPGLSTAGKMQAFTRWFAQERTADEVRERFAVLDTPEARELERQLGHRGTNAVTVTGLVRWMLDLVGVDLKSRRTGRGDARMMTYRVDQTDLIRLETRARRAAETCVPQICKDSPMHIFGTPLEGISPPIVTLPPPPDVATGNEWDRRIGLLGIAGLAGRAA